MRPRNWDGATVDRSVRNRLRRLDPKLLVTFSPFALDPVTGNPIVTEVGGIDEHDNILLGGPVRDPAFYLWRRHDTYGYVFVRSYPVSNGFGHLDVLRLEADLARFHRPEDVWRLYHNKAEATRLRRAKQESDRLQQKAIDNKKLIRDAAAGGDDFFLRDRKIISYDGQRSRVSSGESSPLRKSDRELGLA